MMVAMLARVVRAAILAYIEGLKPKDRLAFVARFVGHLGFSKVRPIKGHAPDTEAMDWLSENLGDMLDKSA